MILIKVNNTLYPASIDGKMRDGEWDNRESKSITLSMPYADVVNLLPNNTPWSIVMTTPRITLGEAPQNDEQYNTEEYDNSDFCISGDIIDHRDGTVTIKMGKLTEIEEAYAIAFGGDMR